MKFLYTLLLLALPACSSCGQNGPGNVLIIGDSISSPDWGYFNAVSQKLTPKGYNVRWIPENARSSSYTLGHVDQWVNDGFAPRTILWNNGIWDCIPQNSATDDPRNRTVPAQYAQYIGEIAKKLRATGARVIFVTTTPTGDGCEIERNAIARSVLPAQGVEIIDLHQFVAGHPEWHGRGLVPNPADVHFTIPANLEMGNMIADRISH